MERVSQLLGGWADALGLSEWDRCRWRAAGFLHDALREVAPDVLRAEVPDVHSSLPGPILHGPAVAERLRLQGVLDEELLFALTYHTVGHASLGLLGRALYAADFLEPGRDFMPEWREGLRARMPAELDGVMHDIGAARIRHVVDRNLDLLPDTVEFWNVLVKE
jgi:2-amino-4-hydroxy-6-hydroxymethyldihydropteridine diphosphokinase